MLPKEYQQVEYLQSSGTQHINTNLKAKSTISTKIKFAMTSFSGTSGSVPFILGGGTPWINLYVENSKICADFNAGANQTVSTNSPTLNTIYNVELQIRDKYYLVVDGIDNDSVSISSFSSSYNIMLFCRNASGTIGYKASCKIYNCKFYDDGTLVRNFVPAKRKSDNVLGLYDTVNDVFYTNAGSGTFTAGANVYIVEAEANPSGTGTVIGTGEHTENTSVSIEAVANHGYEFVDWTLDGYTQLEYIESTGEQYIDTGVSANSIGTTFKSEIDLQLTTTSQKTYASMGIGNWGSSGYYLDLISAMSETSRYFAFRGGASSTNYTVTPIDTQRHMCILDVVNLKGYVDNNNVTITRGTTSSSGNIYLFASCKLGNTAIFNNTQFITKMYSAKFYVNNNLICNFIPVIRHSDAQIGLLDLVNLKFYGNSGTGQFIGGNPV